MKTKIARSVIALLALGWTALVTPSAAQGPSTEASRRGEEYFLIRTLEVLYERWPQNVTSSEEFVATAAELRRDAIRFKVRAERANLHASIVDGFSEFVSQLDAFTGFLSNIGAIQKAAKERASREELDSSLKGGLAAAGTYHTLSQNENFSDGGAVLASLLTGGLTYIIESHEKASARDDAARNAVNVEARRIQDHFAVTLERTRQRFADLARNKGWGDHEIGWDLSPEHAQAVLKMYSQGDFKSLEAECSRQRTTRPFDPFVALHHNAFQALQNADSPTALDRLSADSYSLRHLIPSDEVYSDYKLGAILQAALLASGARDAERGNGASLRSSERSRRAVELWEEVRRLQASDPTGHVRLYRAMAYASDGDTGKARSELESIFDLMKQDSDFLYACSRIFSLDGYYDKSLKFLGSALLTDKMDLKNIRVDHDLEGLKQSRKDEFEKMTTPQWRWNVQNGLVFADVSLTNDSVFTLTNVKLTSATPGWAPDLTVEFLRPGETKKWGWISQPPKDRQAKVSLKCDQSP